MLSPLKGIRGPAARRKPWSCGCLKANCVTPTSPPHGSTRGTRKAKSRCSRSCWSPFGVFQQIAEELSEAYDDADLGAAKRRRRAFASSYLQKLINLTIMLPPYSGGALSKVEASDAGVSERPSRFRQAAPYILASVFAASAVLATVLLWDVG